MSETTGDQSFGCSVVKASLGNYSDHIELHVVTVRPCAEKMGILSLVAYQVLKSAASKNKYVMAVLPVDKIASMVKLLSPDDHSINPSVEVEQIKSLTPYHFRIEKLINLNTINSIHILQLNAAAFPSASDMNDLQKVTQRQMARPVVPHRG